ncbi:hypothetical protein FB45DRAFT_1066251 [Roridomyces roridus]|uniref:BTB domain-containing protein n=1 Tax=Roridomyces roridus TaxID=1738132 RepID=A0AAD7B4S7_9AGAR|nr:hypothetical protein FB45DRAFT_1066251 [Roridomyces roridus]
MSDAPRPAKDAQSPFSGEPDPQETYPASDLILRSCDGVDFHVHKQILAFVSVFFSNMFAFPSGSAPPTELQRDGKSILLLPETEDILYRVLILAYPARSRKLYSLSAADLDSACLVHEAAQKYQFTYAQNLVVEMLMEDTLVDAHPHRLFAIATLRDLPSLGQKAALSTLKLPICPPNLTFPEMRLMRAESLQKLYDFHRLCSKNASDIVEEAGGPLEEKDLGAEGSLTLDADQSLCAWWMQNAHVDGCGAALDFGMVIPAPWFPKLIQNAIPKVPCMPTGATVASEILAAKTAVWHLRSDCDLCCDEGETDLESFARRISRVIDEKNATSAREPGILGF